MKSDWTINWSTLSFFAVLLKLYLDLGMPMPARRYMPSGDVLLDIAALCFILALFCGIKRLRGLTLFVSRHTGHGATECRYGNFRSLDERIEHLIDAQLVLHNLAPRQLRPAEVKDCPQAK